MENTSTTISRPALITYKEFKEKVSHHDGYGKCRRIFLYDYDHTGYRYKYLIALVGVKELCFKEAYRLLFIETDEDERESYIHEGQFKIPISYNFAFCKVVKKEKLETFILGRAADDFDTIIEYPTRVEANRDSEEWVEVIGKNKEDAIAHYEAAFARWQNREGLIVGDPEALKLPYYDKELKKVLKNLHHETHI